MDPLPPMLGGWRWGSVAAHTGCRDGHPLQAHFPDHPTIGRLCLATTMLSCVSLPPGLALGVSKGRHLPEDSHLPRAGREGDQL